MFILNDFFISHSSYDKSTITDELVKRLTYKGYSVWYDKNNIYVGDEILEEIKKGLANSYCLVLILTDNFFNSNWTFFETGLFNTNNNKRIIPVLYDLSDKNKSTILSIIGNRKYIDSKSLNNDEIEVELIKAFNNIRNENIDMQSIENLQSIQKKLATYETVDSEIISIKLKEYLELLNSNSEFIIFAAKRIIRYAINALLKQKAISNYNETNNKEIINNLEIHNIGSINFREHVEFVFNTDNDSFSGEYVTIINHSLSNILTYYIHQKYSYSFSRSQIEIVYPEELKYNDFIDMYNIDRKVMREDLIADVKTTFSWFMHNRFTHIAVRDKSSQKIIGYFSILPVTNEIYAKIVDGDFLDKEFTCDCIEQYIFPDFYRVYVAGVGIDPLFQNTGAFIALYNSLIDLFIYLAKDREIYVSEILAEASTKQGEKFCKIVGMKKISSTKNRTDVYRLITIPPEFRLKNRKGIELYNICKRIYERYRNQFK